MFHLSLWSYDKAPVQILVPLSGKSKEEVVRMGLEMNVPFDVTWSCYWDRAVHCGTCVSCRERRDAVAEVGAAEPGAYRFLAKGPQSAKQRHHYLLALVLCTVVHPG